MSPNEIKSIREILNLTQQKLADLIGARQHTIARWETGLHKPTGRLDDCFGSKSSPAAAPSGWSTAIGAEQSYGRSLHAELLVFHGERKRTTAEVSKAD